MSPQMAINTRSAGKPQKSAIFPQMTEPIRSATQQGWKLMTCPKSQESNREMWRIHPTSQE